jgi:hypothetical protein
MQKKKEYWKLQGRSVKFTHKGKLIRIEADFLAEFQK